MEAIFGLVVGLGLVVLGRSWGQAGSNNWRLGRLERKVDLILKHLGLDPDQDVNPQIIEHMRAGNKIRAIKLYREQTGAGLKEAKDYVERL